MGMSLATKRRGGELLSFYHRVAFEISNYCDRHFNRKNAVWSVGFIVVQFFKCNLQFNMRNKSARRRLPVNGRLAFVRIFYSKTITRRRNYVRQTDNLIPR